MDAPVTLVTGTRKGIGRYLAEHYVQLGHRVVGCSRQPIDWTLPGYCHQTLDVGDEQAVRQLFAGINRDLGRLDHVINNAGVAAMNHALLTPASTVEIRSTQSATGILYVAVIGTFVGETMSLLLSAESVYPI